MGEVSELAGKLRRLLRSRGRSHHDVEDLTQEAFLRLQVYCRDKVVHHEEAFLVRTALNLSAEQGRRQSRRAEIATGGDALGQIMDPAPRIEDVLVGEERLRRLTDGLQRLSPRTREVFLLHRSEGLSYPQIGSQLDISVSMVEKHVARAMYFLRDWMARCEA